MIALLDQAGELLGYSDALEALVDAYRPGRTFAQAFADFYRKVFAAQGLLVFDATRARCMAWARQYCLRQSIVPTSCTPLWWSVGSS